MLSCCQFAGANTTVRAGLSNLLPRGRWDAIANASNLPEVVEVLMQCQAYRALALTAKPVSTKDLERRLRAHLALTLHPSHSFLIGSLRNFVKWWWRRFEVSNLLVLLRGLHQGVSAARIRSLMISLEPASELNWQALRNTSSIADLAGRLTRYPEGAFYSQALHRALQQYERTGLVFELETALTLAYYQSLRRKMRQLQGTDSRAARSLIGAVMDGQILVSAYRYRIYFDFKPERILSHTVPRGARIGPETVQRIASGAPLHQVALELWEDELPALEELADKDLREALVRFEFMYRRYLHESARYGLRKGPLSLYTLLAYDRLLEDEIDDLVTLIECAVIGVDPQNRQQHLIGSGGRT